MIKKIKDIIKNKLYRHLEENDITIEELKKLQKEGAIVIDVRSPQEYKEGHISGAILVPEYEFKKYINQNLLEKNQKIIVYCSSGGRSKNVQKLLKKLGYKNVYNLYEGY